MLEHVKHIILVMSGKGGVGKSTVSVNLAKAFQSFQFKVGVLDVDLCGPSIPRMLGLEEREVKMLDGGGWQPVSIPTDHKGIKPLVVMSIGFLLHNKDDAVVWRGPRKTAMIKEFLTSVAWGELDFLIIDTPPGTSDEHIGTIELLLKHHSPDGCIMVTTPQAVSCVDVDKEITFCEKMHLPILGLVENMSGYVCPHCSECTNIFSSGGGKLLAEKRSIPFLGSVPIDPRICQSFESNGQEDEQGGLEILKKFIENVYKPKCC